MKKGLYFWLTLTLLLVGAAYGLELIAPYFSSSWWTNFVLLKLAQVMWIAAPIAFMYTIYVAINGRVDVNNLLSMVRDNRNRPLVLYGALLILLSYVWSIVTPRFVNPNTDASVLIVLGGALLLSTAGLTLIGYRIWTKLSRFFH